MWRFCLLLLLAGPAAAQPAQPSFPPFTGLVVDAADVLPPATEADLTAKLQALQRDTKRQLVVATIADMQGRDLADYGYRLGRAWGVGLKNADNGIILFIAPNEPAGHRGPRIEIGRGLEPIVTDALASQIITERMMPQLQASDVPGAMTAGTDALVRQLRAAPEEAQAKVDAAAAAFDQAHRGADGNTRDDGGGLPIGLIFWGVVFLFLILPALSGGRRRRGRRWSGGGGNWPIVLWSIGNELGRSGGGGGWGGGGSGGSSGSSWGGGGFTGGGGGSFGGGGASGSW